MSKWQDKSNFEINKAVARVQGFFYESPSCTSVIRHKDSALYLSRDNGWSKVVDYCNNPTDAWPIILKHGVDILSPSTNGTENWFAGFFDPHSIAGAEDIKVYDKNPLRAAMIVYLEMN